MNTPEAFFFNAASAACITSIITGARNAIRYQQDDRNASQATDDAFCWSLGSIFIGIAWAALVEAIRHGGGIIVLIISLAVASVLAGPLITEFGFNRYNKMVEREKEAKRIEAERKRDPYYQQANRELENLGS